ncbi:MAG: hypothetical protein ABL895_21030 [Cyclobacteriaceae bacterium]
MKLARSITNSFLKTISYWCLLLLLIVASGCTVPKLVLNQNVKLDTLRVSLIFSQEVPDIVMNELENQFDAAVIQNNSSNKLKIQRVSGRESGDLQIRVLKSTLVTPQQQTAGVFVSTIGLSLPFFMASAGADFVIFFWYFPKMHSAMELALDPSINGSPYNPVLVNLRSPGFLKSPERQISKHGVYFNNYLIRVIKDLKKK